MCFLSYVVVIPSFRNEKSANLLRTVLVRERLNHYGTMAQRGLSSTFSRKFFNCNNITGLVKTSQHIHSGVTKRGTVDIVFERDGIQYDLCNVRPCYFVFRRVFHPINFFIFFSSSVRSVQLRTRILYVAERRFGQPRHVRRGELACNGRFGIDRIRRAHQTVLHVYQSGSADGTHLVRYRIG